MNYLSMLAAKVYLILHCLGSEVIALLYIATLLFSCHPEKRRNQSQYLRSRLYLWACEFECEFEQKNSRVIPSVC